MVRESGVEFISYIVVIRGLPQDETFIGCTKPAHPIHLFFSRMATQKIFFRCFYIR